MSINETIQQPSNLTPTQQRDQLGAVYGLGGALDPNNLNPEQAEFLRGFLSQYDRDHTNVAEFDLNKPPLAITNPKAKGPYRYQEYPRMIYHHERRTTETVISHAQLDYYLARGYSKEPFPPEDADAEQFAPILTEENAREAAALDAAIKHNKRK
jgi:hypothetical protein